MKQKVKIGVRFLNLPILYEAFFARISVSSGGYIHEKDIIETVPQNSENPSFQNVLSLEYLFEEKQSVRAEIYGTKGTKTRCIGYAETSVGRVVHSGGEIQSDIVFEADSMCTNSSQDQISMCIFTIKEDENYKENIELKMRGYNLDKKDFFGKSDPYFKMYRKSEKGKYCKTYRSEIIKNTLNPDWKPMMISIDKFCNQNLECEICVKCFDWDGAKGDPEDMDNEFDEIIGEFITTAREIIYPFNCEKKFELINSKKKRKKRGYVNSGIIVVTTSEVVKEFTFLDHMFGGTDLNFIVAIDLTSNDSESNNASSAINSNDYSTSEYSIAIQAVLEILQEYDSDELFPAFGFGARVAPDFKICHEYPLTGNFSNPFCKGVKGVISAYHETLQRVKLSGPPCFAPVIRQVINLAKQYQDGSHYFILLILTDGKVDDWIETKKAVIEASYLPISIIVVGVGGGNFLDMKTLDQDFGLLKVGKDQACRDNVQFVPMRKFLRPAADGSDNVKWSKIGLAKEVLAELPEQFLDFMKRHNFKPSLQKTQIQVDSISISSTLSTSSKETAQQRLRRCATAYGNAKSFSERSFRKGSTDGLNIRSYNGNRKCSMDSQFKDDTNGSSPQPRNSFSEHL